MGFNWILVNVIRTFTIDEGRHKGNDTTVYEIILLGGIVAGFCIVKWVSVIKKVAKYTELHLLNH